MKNKNEEKLYILYIHENKINNKKYIGITCRTENERWRNGQGYVGQPFYNAIKKYGWDGFEHKVVYENLTCSEACKKEIELIKKYKTTNKKFGYNADKGGFTGYYFTDEQRKLASEKISGGKNPMAKKIFCDGVIFDCLEDCAKKYNKDANTMSDWMNGVYGIPQEFIDMNLRYVDKEPIYKKRQKYGMNRKTICNNIIFDTATNCANYYNVKPSTMTKWLNGINRIPEEYLDMGLRYLDKEQNENIIGSENKRKSKVKCLELEKEFDSISECIDYFNKNLNIKLKSSEISRVSNGIRKSTKGYHFIKII